MTQAVAQKIGNESKILARDLMTELTAVVNTLGGHKVVVGFSGEGAYCDKDLSYVNIPALPETDFIPIRVAQYIRGFAAHEAAHLAFTDPTIAIVRRDGKQDALQHTLWNCIEDAMIEKYWLALYPGAKKNFAATETYACEEYFKALAKFPEQVYDLRIIGGVALTWMRAVGFGLGTDKSVDALNTLPADIRQKVEGWYWNLVEPCETTQECLEAAWIIYDEIMKNPLSNQTTPQIQQALAQQACNNPGTGKAGGNGTPSNKKGQGKPGQGNGQGPAQPGNGQPGGTQPGNGQPGGTQSGNGQPGGAGNGQPGTQGAGQGQGQGGKPNTGPITPGAIFGPGAAVGDPTANPNATAATGFGPTPQPYPVGFDLDKALDAAAVPKGTDYQSVEILSTRTEGPAQAILAHRDGASRATGALDSIRSAVSKTASELRRALKTYSKARVKTGRMDGLVDSRRLTFAASGSLEYHKKVIKGLDVDTAVSILIDCSGSMDGHRIQMCQQMALILESALSNTPVKHEILGFTTGSNADLSKPHKVALAAAAKNKKQANIRGISLYEFRKFGTAHALALETLGNMCHAPMGGTPTAPAILMAHDRLARRKERRHVMFVLTDGQSDDANKTRKAVEAVEACGVTVVGIGIGTTTVRREFHRFAYLNTATDLPGLMLRELTGIILGEKHKKGMRSSEVKQKRHFTA